MSPARAIADLRWYFDGSAEAELGVHGQSYEPRGNRVEGADVARQRDEAAARWSDVGRRLAAMPEGQARVLSVVYTPARWPAELGRWYDEGPVAALLLERERLARPNGHLRPIHLEDHDPARAVVRSGALVPIPNAERHEDLMRAARLVAAKKGDEMLDLKARARATLREAVASFRAGGA